MVSLMLDWKHKLMLGVLAAGLVGGVVGFRTWLSEHDQRLQAQDQAKAAEAVRAQVQEQMAALSKRMEDRDAAYQNEKRIQDTKFSQMVRPEDLAQFASQLMELKSPIQLVTPLASDGNAHPERVAQVPQIDFPQAKVYLQECESCKLERGKLQADAADREAQAKLAQKQMDLLKGENTDLRVTLKGGTWWQRTKRAGKWLAIGAGAGAVALCATGHCR